MIAFDETIMPEGQRSDRREMPLKGEADVRRPLRSGLAAVMLKIESRDRIFTEWVGMEPELPFFCYIRTG